MSVDIGNVAEGREGLFRRTGEVKSLSKGYPLFIVDFRRTISTRK